MPNPDYFTLAEFRTLANVGDGTKYPDARVLAAAAYITAIVEREVGTSFVLREKSGKFDGAAFIDLGPFASSLVSVAVAGAPVSVDNCLLRAGMLRNRSGAGFVPWTSGVENIEVTWLDGYSTTPPPDVKEAVMLGTRAHLIEVKDTNIMSDRETSRQTGDGGVVSFIVAGGDHPTGYPKVDAMIVSWRDQLGGFGFGFA